MGGIGWRFFEVGGGCSGERGEERGGGVRRRVRGVVRRWGCFLFGWRG